MNKTIEKGGFLLELQDNKHSFNILAHWGDTELIWYRIGRTGGYFQLRIFGRRVLGWKTKNRNKL